MKKVIGIAVAIVLFLVLIIVVVVDGGNEDEVCVEDGGGSSSGDVVVDGDFAYPSDKEATQETSPYGPREGGMHFGLDIAGPRGTPIYAFADGRVIQAQDSGVQGFGGWVVVEHNIDGKKIQTVYGHEEPGQVKVKTGDKVTKGQHIADMGSAGQSSGPHLHFEVVEGDRAAGGERVDPKPWLEKAEDGKKSESSDSDSKKSKSKGSGQPADEKGGFEGLSGRQLALAKQIVAIGEGMGVDEKGRQIAVATAKHESQLQVYANDGVITPEEQSGMADGVTSEKLKESLDLPHDAVSSDHGSVGTFQQQVGIWGEVEELMNPAVQAKKFYEHLEEIDYQGMEVGAAASKVQGNATGTGVYQQEADVAAKLVDKYRGAGKDLSEEEIEALGEANVGDGCDIEVGNGASSDDSPAPSGELGERIVAAARKEFGYPYVWGGGDENGPTKGQDGGEEGYDCSGLVLRAVAVATKGKVKLPHQTQAQTKDEHLKKVDWEDKKPGDLIFLGGEGAEHHVGIYSGKKDGKDKWIEAQTFGVDSGEYDVRTNEPHQAYRVSE